MSNKYFFLLAVSFFMIFGVHAQDLIRKVPAESNLLVTVNNRAVFKHLSVDDVNGLLTRLNVFGALSKSEEGAKQLEDLGIDFNNKAYFYWQVTDSIQYFGGLIPLADVGLFENIVNKGNVHEIVDGLNTIYSQDRTFRLSWDRNSAYLLLGIPTKEYFKRIDVRERYDLPEDPYSDSYLDFPAYAPADSEEVEVSLDEMEAPISPSDTADVLSWEDEYRGVDSVLSQDGYQDDYYTQYSVYQTAIDSALNVLAAAWVDDMSTNIVSGRVKGFSSNKGFKKLSDNVILDLRVRHLDAVFSSIYPADVLKIMGLGYTGKFQIDHGIEEMSGQFIVDGNKLVFQGEASLDREMTKFYKEIYGKKVNSKFLRYLDRDAVGFMSFNVHTEAYLKHLPRIIDRYYGNLGIRDNDYVGFGTLLFDVLFDEKAISKVFKGDNLLVVDGFEDVEVTYMDYEYDENFEYRTVEKTKRESVPDFLWMFSSDDVRLFEKLLDIGLRKEEVKDLGGVYELKKGNRAVIQLYLLMKDGIVFLGNDLDKLQSIHANRYRGRGYRPYVDMARKNSFSLYFNTSRFKEFIDQLDLPMGQSTRRAIEDMEYYGDFYALSPGVKKKKLTGQIGVQFPTEKGNALSFLLSLIEAWGADLEPAEQ